MATATIQEVHILLYLPTVAFFFIVRSDSADSQDFTDTSEHIRFYFLVCIFPHFSFWFRVLD